MLCQPPAVYGMQRAVVICMCSDNNSVERTLLFEKQEIILIGTTITTRLVNIGSGEMRDIGSNV